MNRIRVILPILLLTWSCVTQQPVKSIQEPEEAEYRAFFLPVNCWNHSNQDSVKIRISAIMDAISNADYNVILLDLSNISMAWKNFDFSQQSGDSDSFDPVQSALEYAHQNGLNIFASLDPLNSGIFENRLINDFPPNLVPNNIPGSQDSLYRESDSGKFLNPAHPVVKTILKKIMRDFVMEYNLDGLVLDFSGFTMLPEEYRGSPDNSSLVELMEDLIVEAMHVKPYLVIGVSFQPGVLNHYPEIKQWINNGMIDLLIPFTKNAKDPSHAEIYAESIEGTVDYPGDACDKTIGKLAVSNSGLRVNAKIPAYPIILPSRLAFSLDVSSLLKEIKGGKSIGILPDGKIRITDSEGRISFLLPEKPDTLEVRIEGSTLRLPTAFWKNPFDYEVSETGIVTRKMPWLEFREMPDPVTSDPEFHMLCKTSSPAVAWINDDTVKVYKTGIFFDKINLSEGMNRVRAGVATEDGESINYTREFTYIKSEKNRAPYPLWIDEKSISPSMKMVLKQDDKVHLSFRGSKGQEARILIRPGKKEILCSRTDFDDYSIYEADITFKDWKQQIPHTLVIQLNATDTPNKVPHLEIKTETMISLMDAPEFPHIRVVRDHARLTYNLGPVRLGGPIRSELPEGIMMQTNGIFGNYYRIFLNEEEEGFVEREDVELLTEPSSSSPFYITSLSCGPSEGGDILSIPYYNPIPYAVYPEPGRKMIRIRLYGAMTSSTWITHLQGRKIIEQVTWSQITPETYEVQIHLRTSRIWGYDLHPDGKRLIFFIKYPPEYTLALEKPLKGLKIAIEAGHGGESYGAMGLSGLLEKDINLDLARRFGKICESQGAEIVQVRNSDTTMLLIDKRNRAIRSEADLLISIHANAAGTSRGYLGVGGTSTYYHNPFWADLAERMYNHLLELDLSEFGVVGSFNYTVIRVSQMPSILVEQAFMTHAEDEEKLASPEFRQAMAEKMYHGIIDFLTNMKKE